MEQITPKERKVLLRIPWGNKIRIDELCTCGHRRSEHSDTWTREVIMAMPEHASSIVGHGSCIHPACPCKKFTWKRTIFRSPRVRGRARI